jgi:uncharacterized DUF497 family protein
MLKFEWDINKANAHQKKQGVTFEEASTVLSDVFSITVTDPLHPENEERWVTIGQSDKHRTLIVVHTERGDAVRLNVWQTSTKGRGMNNMNNCQVPPDYKLF